MEVIAATEAIRLELHHLARVYLHDDADAFSCGTEWREGKVVLWLEKNSCRKTVCVTPDLLLHKTPARAEKIARATAFARVVASFTSYRPPYGILTGVRPVKVALWYLEQGMTREAVRKVLEDTFLAHPDKATLLLDLAEAEQKIKKSSDPSGVMLYLSIPFCPSRCSYCSFISSAAPKERSLIGRYLDQLTLEMQGVARLLQMSKKTLTAVYVGGGTPGILTEAELERLLVTIKETFSPKKEAEFCVEIGRPDTVTREKLSLLYHAGVDRICINPQTTCDQTLERIGRCHKASDYFRAMELAMSFPFSCVNSDLIAALPDEKPQTFLQSLTDVLSFSPQNVTIHALCRKTGATERLSPTAGEAWRTAVETAHQTCMNQGLVPYYLYRQKNAACDLENLGFATPETRCLYNVYMMEDLCDIIACGAGAISKILPRETGGKIRRFASCKYPLEYVRDPRFSLEKLQRMEEVYRKEHL